MRTQPVQHHLRRRSLNQSRAHGQDAHATLSIRSRPAFQPAAQHFDAAGKCFCGPLAPPHRFVSPDLMRGVPDFRVPELRGHQGMDCRPGRKLLKSRFQELFCDVAEILHKKSRQFRKRLHRLRSKNHRDSPRQQGLPHPVGVHAIAGRAKHESMPDQLPEESRVRPPLARRLERDPIRGLGPALEIIINRLPHPWVRVGPEIYVKPAVARSSGGPALQNIGGAQCRGRPWRTQAERDRAHTRVGRRDVRRIPPGDIGRQKLLTEGIARKISLAGHQDESFSSQSKPLE